LKEGSGDVVSRQGYPSRTAAKLFQSPDPLRLMRTGREMTNDNLSFAQAVKKSAPRRAEGVPHS
jgi:hypothetical protein